MAFNWLFGASCDYNCVGFEKRRRDHVNMDSASFAPIVIGPKLTPKRISPYSSLLIALLIMVFRICGVKPDPEKSAGLVHFCFRRNKLLRLVLINKLINIRYKVD